MSNHGGAAGGLAGKVLRINLSSGEIRVESTADYIKNHFGGRTVNSDILVNETRIGTRWSDPENMLILGAGSLVGTLTPGACRASIDTINAYNNGKGSANFGGFFGAELKFAGYDHVIISGISEKPIYIFIADHKILLKDARSIWGKGTSQTQRIIQQELGESRVRVLCIGPAGENLVTGACVVGDTAKVAGGSGIGCVMGAKKLKAIAVLGSGGVKIANPDQFFRYIDLSMEKISSKANYKSIRNTLISESHYPEAPLWDISNIVRNGQDQWWPMEKKIKLTGEKDGVPRYRRKVLACYNCPIGCIPYSEIDEGAYKGTKGSGYWINSVQYSQKFDVCDADASLAWHIMTNEYGLDGDMASVTCSWAFECFEKGLITLRDTDGLRLEWGNGGAMVELLRKVVFREGLGELLSRGVKEAAAAIGGGSDEFALYIKDMDTQEDFRIKKGWGLGVATSPVGGRHLRGAVSLPAKNGPPDLDFDTTSYDRQPEAVYYQSIAKEIEDALGICVFIGSFSGVHALFPQDYVDLIGAVMGLDITVDELFLSGRVGYNLEKAFNTIHAGFDRTDDLPPKRFMTEPVQSGPFAGMIADEEHYNNMLDQFYLLHGWDTDSGRQTRSGLEDLGLHGVASKLAECGRLIED